MIASLDVGAAYRELREPIDAAMRRVLESGWFVLGPEVEAFEEEFACLCGTTEAVGVGSGLDALTLVLRALEIGRGDEVLVPSNTFVATWLAVSAVGARPVPVEPDVATHNVTADAVAGAIGPRTRAVVCVHLYGRLCETRELRALCDEHGIALVEDAAQAHGARNEDGRAGALGHAAAFSFYPAKNLGALGDGGAVTTSDPLLADRVRLLRNYGSRRRYEFEAAGVNSRLDPLQAAVLRVKLTVLDEWNERRRALAERYRAQLAGVPGIALPAPSGADHVHHLFVVRCERRDELRDELRGAGVDAQIHYPIAPHRSGAYAELDLDLPVADRLASEVLTLPLGPHLDEEDADVVIGAVRRLRAGAAV
ncbi:DegT/DnrJ/EryC1/StrS family aminotransferase [Capillimicrobium parvum]|uniref:dTDP-3-amino-3,4,6-trideoxy-alpha-D-glucose transaminase n=1 Tax=Capillimicrobium parvum TaxID=2884022 RepID=A0A9E7BYS4_9ACTN|nr:DegT/DnrJ/EryC1/StrS family aminotransferase [Capillimicrobium parvum]UGS33764.1 dTDP-3-amino-3,4,6-trideoxy-alpha-D-glucose transaminase [Capillimicrobium parvum]